MVKTCISGVSSLVNRRNRRPGQKMSQAREDRAESRDVRGPWDTAAVMEGSGCPPVTL